MGGNQNKKKRSRVYRGARFDYDLGSKHDSLKRIQTYILYSSLAQLVERMTVNHDVAGSSPAGGAIKRL